MLLNEGSVSFELPPGDGEQLRSVGRVDASNDVSMQGDAQLRRGGQQLLQSLHRNRTHRRHVGICPGDQGLDMQLPQRGTQLNAASGTLDWQLSSSSDCSCDRLETATGQRISLVDAFQQQTGEL